MPIGDRLREERQRLGMSQPEFAALVNTTKKTLFSWETGKTAPDAFQLEALSAHGADVLYILTGQRSLPPPAAGLRAVPSSHPPPSDEQKLLADYRACDAAGRQAIRATSRALAQAAAKDASAPRGRRAG